MMRSMLSDMKHGFRVLRAAPLFAIVAVLTLGIGIGANAAMLALFDALLFRPPPGIHNAADVVRIATESNAPAASAPRLGDLLSFVDYAALRDRAQGFSAVGAFTSTGLAVGDEDATNEQVLLASGQYFNALGARPALGRLLQPQDDRDAAPAQVAVLSYNYWKRAFGGQPNVIGSTIHIARIPFIVVGVTQEHFTGTDMTAPALWLPLGVAPQVGLSPEMMSSPWVSWLTVVARIRPGVSHDNARTAAQTALLSIQEEKARIAPPTGGGGPGLGGRVAITSGRSGNPGPGNNGPAPVTAAPRVVLSSIGGAGASYLRAGNDGPGQQSPPVQLWYLALTGALLLIACANVATLLLAQGSRRAHELAVRASLGAPASRLLRQLLTENVCLAALGGAAGFAVAYIIWSVLPRAISIPELPPLLSLRPLIVTATLSFLTVALFGLVPALGMRRPDLRGMLGAAAPTIARRSITRSMLVILQLAASLVLLISAGLITRSLRNVRAADLGFASNNVLEVMTNLRGHNWSPAQVEEFWQRARDAAQRVNGVAAAGIGAIPPYAGRMMIVTRVDDEAGQGRDVEMTQDFADPGYFNALGIRLLEGRAFTADDRAGGDRVVIINTALAKKLFGAEGALGKCMPGGPEGQCSRIVGIADNARLNEITGDVSPQLWRPLAQRPPQFPAGGVLHVRTTGDPSRIIPTLRAQIAALAPDLPFINIRPVSEALEPTMAPWRAATILLSVLSISGLALAAIGLYGVTAFLVTQRTREIGIRVAVGAERRHILADIIGGGLRLTAVGVGAGIIAAAFTSRLFASLMYGVTAVDPFVYIATVALLTAVALLACILPARRATRIDPVKAFRAT